MNSILSPRGQQMVQLGGDRAWLQRVKGDIVVSYQWLEIPGHKDPQPCMTLFPSVLKLDGGAYVIPQANAYEYVDGKGSPTPHLLIAAMNAATTMGFFADQSTVFRIVDIVADGLADLVRMPSDQPGEFNATMATLGIEASAKVNGQVIHQEVL